MGRTSWFSEILDPRCGCETIFRGYSAHSLDSLPYPLPVSTSLPSLHFFYKAIEGFAATYRKSRGRAVVNQLGCALEKTMWFESDQGWSQQKKQIKLKTNDVQTDDNRE